MSKKTNNAQISPVVPLWFGEISAEGLDEDLVFVELEDDVGEPPVLFALETIAVACRSAGRGTRLEGFLDHIGHGDTWREGETTS